MEYNNAEFIKLNRKILNWEWYSEPVARSLFLHCLIKANWKDTQWMGVTIYRGQFVTSLDSLSVELGFTVQRIRTALKRLISTGELTSKTTNKYRVITVVNYDKYQCSNKQDNKQLTNKQQATNNQLTINQQTTNNSTKNIKNNKNLRTKEEKNNTIDVSKDTSCTEQIRADVTDCIVSDYSLPVKGGKYYTPTDGKISEWLSAFPNLDILAEFRKMHLWLNDNPQKRKTITGMNRFISSWLGRCQGKSSQIVTYRKQDTNPVGKSIEEFQNWVQKMED